MTSKKYIPLISLALSSMILIGDVKAVDSTDGTQSEIGIMMTKEELTVEYEEYYAQKGYSYVELQDCDINSDSNRSSAISVREPLLDKQFNNTGCYSEPFTDFNNKQSVFLVNIEFEPVNISAAIDSESNSFFSDNVANKTTTITANDSQGLKIERVIKNDELTHIQTVVTSDVLNISKDYALIRKITVKGLFIKYTTDSISNSVGNGAQNGIVNGDFSNGNSGWISKSKWDGSCPYIGNDIGDQFPLIIRSDFGNNYALEPRTPATANSERCLIREMQQTVVIPETSKLTYRWRVRPKLEGQIRKPSSLYAMVKNLTSGRLSYSKHTRSSDSDSFTTGSVNSALVRDHTVNIRFKVQDSAVSRLLNLESHAGIHIDDVALVAQSINTSATPQSGLWYNPQRSGHGLQITKSYNNEYIIVWYTYRNDGTPIWYMSDLKPVQSGRWTGGLSKFTWNQSAQTNSGVRVGDMKLEMFDNKTLKFSWDFYSINGNNTGFDGSEYMVHLFGNGGATGLWYEPALSGWGFSLDYQNSTGHDSIITTYVYDGSEPVWLQGSANGTPTNNKNFNMRYFTSTGLCPSCTGTITTNNQDAGSVHLNLDSSTSGTGWTEIELPNGSTWNRGNNNQSVNLGKLTH